MASSDILEAPVSDITRHPFDAVAASYDSTFTDTPLGRWYRNQVWARFATAFRPGEHILDLGCGTGEDAIWLASQGIHVIATDASNAMIEAARTKAVAASLEQRVTFGHLDLANVDAQALMNLSDGKPIDGAYSSFGPLNCLPDQTRLAATLYEAIRPNGHLILVVMGPFCPWEIAWHLARGEFRTAFRRLRSGARATFNDGSALRVWYPSMSRLERAFSPCFQVVERYGLGLLLPPTAMASVVARAPRLFGKLAVIDRRAGHRAPWLWMNDHYTLHLERQSR